jgi:shikimate dehydrogenase
MEVGREAEGSDNILRVAVIGIQDPGAYVDMATSALAAMGIRPHIRALDVPKGEFENCIRQLAEGAYKGAFVTNPFKVDAARVAERFWVARYALGVANALMFDKGTYAQNTEVPAIVSCLKDVPPATALVMGTGHAARSVVAALFELNWKIRVWNRNANKTRILQTLFKRYGDVELAPQPDPSGCRLVINATPLGAKAGEQAPLQWARVLPKTVCFDLVYRRVPTEFLRTGALKGLQTIDGRELLVEQAALGLEWWTGRPVPREPMRASVSLKPKRLV